MKHSFALFALIGLVAATLSSCAYPPRVQWVHTGRVIQSSPGIVGPVYTINNVALQQYSPNLYSPFLYDHRGLDDNNFYQAQALRHPSRQGTVHVGPLMMQASANPPRAKAYEVRRAVVMR